MRSFSCLRSETPTGLLALALLALVATGARTAFAHDQSYAFLWADQPLSGSYSPYAPYRYNDAGESIQITRLAVGEYSVQLHGTQDLVTSSTHAQVSSYGNGASHYCKVADANWLAESVTVHCFDATGSPADTRFTLLYLIPDEHDSPIVGVDLFLPYGFARADQPTTPSYTVFDNKYNAGTTKPVDVVRSTTGRYTVSWTDLDLVGSGGGNAQVTAYGSGNERCQVVGWGDQSVSVACFDPAGSPVDSAFNVLLWRPEADDPGLGFAYAGNPTSASYTPSTTYSYNAAGGSVAAERFSQGRYRMTWNDLDPTATSYAHIQVSAYGTTDARCRVRGWVTTPTPSTYADIDCFDSTGAPVDARYSVILLWPPKKPWLREFAFATTHSPGAAVDDLTSDERAFNYAGGSIVVQRSGAGVYVIDFESFDLFAGGGNVQVTTSYSVASPGAYCNVSGWSGSAVDVNCYDRLGNPLDSRFSVFYVKPPPGATAAAYAWANQSTAPSYTPPPEYAQNPGGGAINAQRFGVGDYRMTFTGFDAIGSGGGHVQVTPYGTGNNARCTVVSWSPDAVIIRCFDPTGAPIDSQYSILFLRPDPEDDAIAFGWVDDPEPGAYVLNEQYSFNSGDGRVIGSTSTLGWFSVIFEGFEERGIGPGNAQVSTYGTVDVRCGVGTGNESAVSTRCWDSAGVPAGGLMNVLFIKPIAAPEPAATLLLASGVGLLAALARRRGLGIRNSE